MVPQPQAAGNSVSQCYRVSLLLTFLIALATTCGVFINSNGVRSMWRRANIPCEPSTCSHNLARQNLLAAVYDPGQPPIGDEDDDDDGEIEVDDLDGRGSHPKLEADEHVGTRLLRSAGDSAASAGEYSPVSPHGQGDNRVDSPVDHHHPTPGDHQLAAHLPSASDDTRHHHHHPHHHHHGAEPAVLSAGGYGVDPSGGGVQPSLIEAAAVDLSAAGEGVAAARESDVLVTPQRGADFLCPEGEEQMKEWLKMFQSVELIFACAGPILDLAGPKLTFAGGELSLAFSIVLLFYGYYNTAMIVAGATTQLILNSVLSIANLFGNYRNLAMMALASGADISQYLFPLFYVLGSFWPAFDYYTALICWIGVALICAVAGLLLLPMKPFPDPLPDGAILDIFSGSEDQATPIFSRSTSSLYGTASRSASQNSLSLSPAHAAALSHQSMPLLRQIFSVPYFLFTIVWTGMAIRMNAYLDGNEDILRSFGDDGSMALAFGYLFPLSFVPCVFVGWTTDKKGIMFTTGIIHFCSLIVHILSLVPNLRLQWLTVVFFIIFKSSLFGTLFGFVAEVYGFKHFGTLVAIPSFFGGGATYILGLMILRWAQSLKSWFWPNVTFLAIGVISQVILLVMSFMPSLSHQPPTRHAMKSKKYSTTPTAADNVSRVSVDVWDSSPASNPNNSR